MAVLQILTCILLLGIAIQDFRSREVYWIFFPMAAVLLSAHVLGELSPEIWAYQFLVNLGFLLVFIAVLMGWFRIKHGGWINILDEKIGLGDILFIICLALFLPPLNLMLFLAGTSIFALVIAVIFRFRTIPLAGVQAACLGLLLAIQGMIPVSFLLDQQAIFELLYE